MNCIWLINVDIVIRVAVVDISGVSCFAVKSCSCAFDLLIVTSRLYCLAGMERGLVCLCHISETVLDDCIAVEQLSDMRQVFSLSVFLFPKQFL